MGETALPRADHRRLHSLVADPGRARRPVRVQQRALEDDLAGVLDAVVDRRARQRPQRSRAAGRAQAHALPRRALRPRGDAARRRARARAAALARPRARHGQHGDAAAARDAGDRDGRRAAPPLPAGASR